MPQGFLRRGIFVVARFVCVLFVLALVRVADTWAQVEVTTCGQTVFNGYLSADLDCTGFGVPGELRAAVVLTGGLLELRGHTITGGEFGVACAHLCQQATDGAQCDGCYCTNSCTVVGGGGSITGSAHSGITGDIVKVTGVTLSNHGERGVNGYRTFVTSCTITGNGQIGAYGMTVKVDRSTITGNGVFGAASARTLVLSRSTVTGNGIGPSCSSPPNDPDICGDITAAIRPRLRHSTCDVSRRPGSFYDWDVCTLD